LILNKFLNYRGYLTGKKIAAKGNKKMDAVNLNQRTQVVDKMNIFTTFPIAIEVQPDRKLEKLLADLSPDTSWGDRQIAAQKLGYMSSREALPGLLAALPADPFWMVRCAIIQALEMIGDPGAIPTLREIAKSDGFQVVRSYAAKASERLSLEG
jgi:HEAT repeat protein